MSGQTFPDFQAPLTLVEALAVLLEAPAGAQDRARTCLHLLDWTGCAVAGRAETAGRILLSRMEAGAGARAFAWGGLGNILEMDDVDKRALLHPGPSIIPAALSLAIEQDLSGDVLLDAIVRGYEATIRLGRAVGPGHYALWHNTGTCGAIGAAAACASLLGLDRATTAHALALAVSQSAGLWQTRHEPASMGKQLHTAVAARAGLDAARLAAAGFKGPLTILEGPQGFFAAMCPGADPADVIAGDEGWRIHDVSFKPWPACRHAHATIDAALALRDRVDMLDKDGDVLVETYRDALTFCDKPEPGTVIEAKFSLQHSVAVVMARGRPKLEDFSLEAVADPELMALRKRVKVRQSPAFQDNYPSRFGASVTFAGQTETVPDALGDPENPVGLEQLRDKARALFVAGGLNNDEAEALRAAAETASPGLAGLICRVLS